MMMRKAPRAGAAKARRGVRAASTKTDKKPQLMDFVSGGDYTGAVALLEFNKRAGEATDTTLPWLGYSAFHLGDYKKAQDAYEEMLAKDPEAKHLHLFIATCLYYQQMYTEAEAAAQLGPANALQNRILFHVAHKMGDENKLMMFHQRLTDSQEDQLSLAAIHYLRSHFQEVRLSLCLPVSMSPCLSVWAWFCTSRC